MRGSVTGSKCTPTSDPHTCLSDLSGVPLLHPRPLIADLDYQLACRLSATQVSLGLSHALGTERVLVEYVDFHGTLAHDVEEEVGVMSALLRSDYVIHHYRAQKPDVLLRELEERERRYRARSIPQGNERSFPLQELEVVVEPGRGNRYTVCRTDLGKKPYVSFPTPSKTASTPTPFVISSTFCTVSSLVYRMT